MFVLRWKIDLPLVVVGLGDHHREGCFAELNVIAAVRSAGDKNISGDFCRMAGQAPDGLALKEPPAGLLDINRRQGRGSVAGTRNEKKNEDGVFYCQ